MGRIILLVLILMVVGLVVAIKLLPWWALVAIFVALPLAVILFFKFMLKRLFLMPFKAKGAVLRGAEATVHSIERANTRPFNPEAEELEEKEPRDYYQLDVTITPKPPKGKFTMWEAGELQLVRPDAKPLDKEVGGDDSCKVEKLEVEEEGQFKPDEGYKYDGARRLRLLLGVNQGVRQLKFRYYFETFGDVRLP